MDKKRNRGVMLFISVLLHGLLALLPWQEKSRPLAVSSTPTNPISPASPISVVDASQLPTLPASEPQPVPSSPTSPPVDPPWTVDAPISETSDSPEPAPEVVPEAGWTADASIPETNNNPETAPEAGPNSAPTPVTPADEAQIAAEWDYLIGHLESQNEGLNNLLDIFSLFGEPGQVNQFFDENNQPRLDVSSFSHFITQTPEEALKTLIMPELISNTGFELQHQDNVSAGLAYQLLQGEMLRYFIIVELSEGNGSVLLFSESLAGLKP